MTKSEAKGIDLILYPAQQAVAKIYEALQAGRYPEPDLLGHVYAAIEHVRLLALAQIGEKVI